MDTKRKNLVLGTIAGVLFLTALIVVLFRDSLFGTGLPSVSPAALEAAKQDADLAQPNP
jgi:hypothetical protein